jgi:hypothetical protein
MNINFWTKVCLPEFFFEIARRQHGLARHHRLFLPQSSSASRFTAGAAAFFIFEPIRRAAGTVRRPFQLLGASDANGS